jgi:hypothetical protein
MTETTSDNGNDITRTATSSKAGATTSSNDPAPITNSVTQSPLFKLSPELRNKIYRLVLVIVPDYDDYDPGFEIIVDKATGIPEPALLLSNKVIRSEASGIFYYENNFSCNVTDFDPAPMLLLRSKFTMPFSRHPMNIEVVLDHGSVDWKNLVSWVHMCHEGKCAPLIVQDDLMEFRCESRVLEAMFEVATGCPEMSSSTLQKVIEPLRYVLAEHNDLWMQ